MNFTQGQTVYVRFYNKEPHYFIDPATSLNTVRYTEHEAWHTATVQDVTRAFVIVRIYRIGLFTFRKDSGTEFLTEKKPNGVFNAELHPINDETTKRLEAWKVKVTMAQELTEKERLISDFNALQLRWEEAGGDAGGIIIHSGRVWRIEIKSSSTENLDRWRQVFKGNMKAAVKWISNQYDVLELLARQNSKK